MGIAGQFDEAGGGFCVKQGTARGGGVRNLSGLLQNAVCLTVGGATFFSDVVDGGSRGGGEGREAGNG